MHGESKFPRFSWFMCTVWKNEKFTVTKKFRQITSLVTDIFSKNVIFTKILPKMCDTKFP